MGQARLFHSSSPRRFTKNIRTKPFKPSISLWHSTFVANCHSSPLGFVGEDVGSLELAIDLTTPNPAYVIDNPINSATVIFSLITDHSLTKVC